MGNENYQSNYGYPIAQQSINKPITISTTKLDYFKDDYVEGTIILQNQLPIVLSDINLNLYLCESWTYTESSSQSYGELNTQPLLCVKVGINKILNINTELINLSAGIFNFPFKFKLPNYLQPCFEFPLPNRRGYLRYSLEAKFISPYIQGCSSIYLIVKARPKVLNSPLSYSSAMNIHKWGLFDQGTTLLKASYLTNNFRVNDFANIKVEINNMRGKLKVTSCEIDVIRKVGFKKKNEDKNQYVVENNIYYKLFQVDVEPMNQRTYDFTIELKDNDKNNFNYTNVSNPYPNVVDISYMMPSVDGAIIKCDYRIMVTLYFNSFVTSGYLPKVTLPISITHQSQEDYNLERKEDEDLQRAIEASKLELEKEKNKINMSVVDKNRMDNNIDRPDGYDIQKMQPISQSQIIDDDNDDNDGLPSKLEIEKDKQFKKGIQNNNNNNNNMNNNINNNQNNINMNINQNNYRNNNNNMNMNYINNNNYNINQNNMNNNYNINQNNMNNNYNINQNNMNNNYNINQNNMNNNYNINQNNMNNNYLQSCPPPIINNIKDDDDDLINPYMTDNKNNKSRNNNNNIQMSYIQGNNQNNNMIANPNPYPNYNNFNNSRNVNYINPNNNSRNFNNNQNLNNNNINQINSNINNNQYNNNIPNLNNNNQNNNMNNNKYPDYNENINNNNQINNNNDNANSNYPDYNKNQDNNSNNNQNNNENINNNYPDFKKFQNDNNRKNEENNNAPVQKEEEIQEEFKTSDDFSIFKNDNGEINNEEKQKEEDKKYEDINAI